MGTTRNPGNATEMLLESFDKTMVGEHRSLIIVSCAAAALLVFLTVVTLILRRRIRTSFLLIVLVWCAQTLAGLLVWQLTYTSMRDALSEQVEIMLLARTSEVALTVKKKMDAGPDMNDAAANLLDNNWLSMNGSFERAINMTQALGASRSDNDAVEMVYYGNRYGYAFGYSHQHHLLLIGTPCDELLLPPEESMFGEEFKCSVKYDIDQNCTEAMCGSAGFRERCGATCGVPTRAACSSAYEGIGAGIKVDFSDGRWLDLEGASMTAFPFPVTQRPWYTQGTTAKMQNSWTEPYVFSKGEKIGVSVVRGVREPSDPSTFLGVLAVDFTISSLDSTMRAGVPTQNSIVLLLNTNGVIMAGSLPKCSLGKKQEGHEQYAVSLMHESSNGLVRSTADALLQRFGTYQNVFNSAEVMLLHEERRMIAVRRAVMEGGLETLVVIVVPYEDVLHKADDASTEALFLTVVISVLSSLLIGGLVMVLMRPLHTLIGAVHDVAHMRLEGMESLDLRGSYLREVNVMSEAMRVLMQNMREYKSFLPEAIFDHDRVSVCKDRDAPGINSGVAAVVFTDIVGSTRLWEASPDGMLKALQQHNEVIRDAIREVNGYEVKTIGDSFMVAFDTAEEGLRFGLRVQEGMAGQEWPESILDVSPDGVVVRIGVNFGPVMVEVSDIMGRADYLGPTVNRAARLEGCCHPRTVTLTHEVLATIPDSLRTTMHIKQVARVTLRGVKEAVPVAMVVPDCLRDVYTNDTASFNPLSLPHDIMTDTTSTVSSEYSGVRCARPDGLASKSRLEKLLKFTETLEVVSSATIGHIENIMNPTSDGLTEEVTSTVNLGLIRIVTYLEITGGKSLTVAGSAGIVGWNATKQCASHVESAFRFVGLLTKSSHDKVHCGLSSGKILTGYVGTRGQRYITAVGPAMRQCIHLSCQAELIGTTALYASEERTATLVLSSRGYIRPVHEATVSGQHVLMFEMHIQRLNQWCHNKLVSLFADASECSVLSLDANEAGHEDLCWCKDYYQAYMSRDFERLLQLAIEDPVVVDVVARLQTKQVAVQPSPLCSPAPACSVPGAVHS